MQLEVLLTVVLKTVCPRVYPDIAPDPMPARPLLTYQQVGGGAVTYAANTVPGKRNSRMQINVWCSTRLEASELAAQIENSMRVSATFEAEPIGSWVNTHDPDLSLYGTMQDFTIWYTT